MWKAECLAFHQLYCNLFTYIVRPMSVQLSSKCPSPETQNMSIFFYLDLYQMHWFHIGFGFNYCRVRDGKYQFDVRDFLLIVSNCYLIGKCKYRYERMSRDLLRDMHWGTYFSWPVLFFSRSSVLIKCHFEITKPQQKKSTSNINVQCNKRSDICLETKDGIFFSNWGMRGFIFCTLLAHRMDGICRKVRNYFSLASSPSLRSPVKKPSSNYLAHSIECKWAWQNWTVRSQFSDLFSAWFCGPNDVFKGSGKHTVYRHVCIPSVGLRMNKVWFIFFIVTLFLCSE